MTRKDLIAAVHTEMEKGANNKMSKSDVERVVGSVFTKITETLAEGTDVSINDFGKFAYSVKAAHTGRNPATSEAIEVPEKANVKFKPATALKNALN